MNPLETVNAFQELMIQGNADPDDVARINLRRLIIDHWERIQEEGRTREMKRVPIGEFERLIIVVVLMTLPIITKRIYSQFSEIMVKMGYRIYALQPQRARWVIECQRRRR